MSSFRKAFLAGTAITVVGFVLSSAAFIMGISQMQGGYFLLSPTILVLAVWIGSRAYRSIADSANDPSIPLRDWLFQLLVLGLLALVPGSLLIFASLNPKFGSTLGLVLLAAIVGLGIIGVVIVSIVPAILIAMRTGSATDKQAADLIDILSFPNPVLTTRVDNQMEAALSKRASLWLKISIGVCLGSFGLLFTCAYMSPKLSMPYSQWLISVSSFLSILSGIGLLGSIFFIGIILKNRKK